MAKKTSDNVCHLPGGSPPKGINKEISFCFLLFFIDYVFLTFLFRLNNFVILDCRLGFSKPNYIYYQLESTGGQEHGKNQQTYSLFIVIESFGANKLRSIVYITAPNRYRKVGNNRRKHRTAFRLVTPPP